MLKFKALTITVTHAVYPTTAIANKLMNQFSKQMAEESLQFTINIIDYLFKFYQKH